MSNIEITTETWYHDNKDWLAHQKGFDTARSVTLDIAAFHSDHKTNGYIKSGIALGKITATGLYGPYDPAGADGTETCTGLLLNAVRTVKDGTTLTKSVSAMIWEGIVIAAKLPVYAGTAKGELDANGKADLPLMRFE